MDSSFYPKRPTDPSSTTDKRRHVHLQQQQQHQQPQQPPLKPASNETLFRILCPAAKTGGIIGKGGAIIRQFREETGAKIRIDDPIPGCDERVILIVADASAVKTTKKDDEFSNQCTNGAGEDSGNSNGGIEDEGSQAQQALVRVFERILKVDEERGTGGSSNDSDKGEEKKEEAIGGGGNGSGTVVCRLLVPNNQVGSVLGRGGRIIEKIRHESGAQVRILPRDHIPACASPGDELIQLTGNLFAVKKALLSVSSCLQDNPRADATNAAATKPLGMGVHGTGVPGQGDSFHQQGYASGMHASDFHPRGHASIPGPDNSGASNRMILEEEVVFKLLCQLDKVGSLIGKGGSVIRALQNETGASIKIVDAAPDSDERVVFISARENSEQKHSPATEAVLRVQSRIAVIGHEPGAAVIARLLVHSQQIGCLLGKGGSIISEMRRATGASIRVFPKDQVPRCGSQNDELVQVIGGLQSVQDALYQITSRIRESIFPIKPSLNVGGPPHFSPFPEMPRPLFRPRHDPPSPSHYSSPVGYHHGDHPAAAAQPFDYQPAFSHGIDHLGPPNVDRGPYSYSSERPAYGPAYDRPSSPRSWTHQAVSSGNPRGGADVGSGLASRTGHIRSGSQAPDMASATVEIVVPQIYLSYVYGENNSNLSQIRQISGAKVIIHDPRPGATEGVVVVSGTSDQLRSAQSLVHAFILCGKTPP